MDRSEYCGCKGIRTCLICEKKYNLANKQALIFNEIRDRPCYTYCSQCDKVYVGWDEADHAFHVANGENLSNWFRIPGICVIADFLTAEEEQTIIDYVDKQPWQCSQSGRRKQNFGPACNFKKHRIKTDNASLPINFPFVQNRFRHYDILKDFFTIEQCFLEYDPIRGACIDPHIDDCWIWGNRIVTVNLLADTVLTLTKYFKQTREEKYNLNYKTIDKTIDFNNTQHDMVVRIPLPRRSLIVLFDEARYMWEHFILRNDIQKRRIAIAYREFTPGYLPGGSNHNEVKEFYSQLEKLYSSASR